jgi:hypothetical protein
MVQLAPGFRIAAHVVADCGNSTGLLLAIEMPVNVVDKLFRTVINLAALSFQPPESRKRRLRGTRMPDKVMFWCLLFFQR